MPELVGAGSRWAQPEFAIDDRVVASDGRELSFTIPTPQEEDPDPHVRITATNEVLRDEPPRGLAITKEVTGGPVLTREDTFTVVYDVVVSNTGEVALAYDLSDMFLFAEGVVVTAVTVENIEPGDIPVNPGFDGAADLAIAGATLDRGTSHRYRVTVTAVVSDVSSVEALDCDLDRGEKGTGFLNRATVNPSAEDCAVIQLLPEELPPTGLQIDPTMVVVAILLGGGLTLVKLGRRRRARVR
jgi:hypothetical protein